LLSVWLSRSLRHYATAAAFTTAQAFHVGSDWREPAGLASKLQKPQAFLKSEGERLQRKIDSALAGIKTVETRPSARGGR
jgi:hypothetical protein